MFTIYNFNRYVALAVVAGPAMAFVAETLIAPDEQHMPAPKASPITTAPVIAQALGSGLSTGTLSNLGGIVYVAFVAIPDQIIDAEYDPTPLPFPLYEQGV